MRDHDHDHDEEQAAINAAPARRRGSLEFAGDVAWTLRRKLVWPLQDRAAATSGRTRVLAGTVVVLAAVGVGVIASGGSGSSPAEKSSQVAVVAPSPAAKPHEVTPPPAASEPTLHGAKPDFESSATKGSGKVGSAKPVQKPSPDAGAAAANATAEAEEPASSSPATDKISSVPLAAEARAPSDSIAAETSAIPGPTAGAKAIAVARKFAGAFVVYETGGEKSEVRRAFSEAATPALTEALLERPPKQPAEVEVPRAKVLNVVPGPSRGGVFTVSVSLLRVGATSELRLEMEKLKAAGWQVTNVLG
jgi:hypothetical protein